MKKAILLGLLFVTILGLSSQVAQANSDGCNTAGQSCMCSNTGRSGLCETGSQKSGLYCQCDAPAGTCPAGKSPNYHYTESQSHQCTSSNQCDGCRSCSHAGYCQGTAR